MPASLALRRLAAAALLALTGCGPITFTVGGQPADRQIETTVVEHDEKTFGPRVAVIDVSGMLVNAKRNSLLSEGDNPVSLLHEKLDRAAQSPRVKAVILRLNTPGGTVTASDVMYRTVQRFEQKTDKPVVALMMDVTTSGGYYLACSADEIVAYPTTVTGSIGVIVQTISLKPALSRLGVRSEAITSGKNKAAGSPLTTLSDEQRRIFQTMVDDFYSRFERIVRQARDGIADSDFARVTDGRVVSGRRAVELGLVDEAGDLYTAFDRAKSRAGLDTADLVRFHRGFRNVASPYARAARTGGAGATQINLAQINLDQPLPGSTPARFYYLWQPAWQQTTITTDD